MQSRIRIAPGIAVGAGVGVRFATGTIGTDVAAIMVGAGGVALAPPDTPVATGEMAVVPGITALTTIPP